MASRFILVGKLNIGFLAVLVLQAWAQYIPTPTGRCVANCDVYVPAPVPQGPSLEELRRQRDARDVREAIDHAYDMGIAAYDRQDWAGAVERFREALRYAPDDPDVRTMLGKAERNLQASRAAAELKATQSHGQAAANAPLGGGGDVGAKVESSKIFDTGGKSAGQFPTDLSAVGGWKAPNRPVIPPEKRTPAIARLEAQLADSEKKITQYEHDLKQAQASKDVVKQTQIKQQISNEQNKANFVSFTINAELEKPREARPASGNK